MVACARDGDGWALLMRDVGEALLRLDRWTDDGYYALTRDDIDAVTDGLAALHARFYGDPVVH